MYFFNFHPFGLRGFSSGRFIGLRKQTMSSIGKVESKVVGKYTAVTEPNNTGGPTLYAALRDEIFPEYNEIIKNLEAVESTAFLQIVIDIEEQEDIRKTTSETSLPHSFFIIPLLGITSRFISKINT